MEKMTNFEKYREQIGKIFGDGNTLAVVDDEPTACSDVASCLECDFAKENDCGKAIVGWLLKSDGESSIEEPDSEEPVKKMHNKVTAARQQGQEEGWRLAERIFCKITDSEFYEIFGKSWNYPQVAAMTYAEAAEKVQAWEESKVIVIGDVVKNGIDSPSYGVVIYRTDMWAEGIKEDGTPFSWCIDDCTKTGRTLPVEDWLRQIGGQEK